jgi:hypothetical protein
MLAHQELLEATNADWRREMRLINRHKSQRFKAPRISFTQEEIAADLHYPASRRPGTRATVPVPRGARR